MSSKAKSDPFVSFRPDNTDVAVGGHSLVLETATLDREARFLSIVEELELHKLIEPIANIVEQASEDGGEGLFIKRIASSGPQLWDAARKVLGSQLAPAVLQGCVALLDTEKNLSRLSMGGLIEKAEPDLGEDGEYLGCAAVRRFIKSELTLLQGVQVIKAAWSMNKYGDLLGNLLAPLMAPIPKT